jgi:hypothetical protein
MAMGRETSGNGGVMSAADVRGGGEMEWASLTGIHPGHPLVSPRGREGEQGYGNSQRIVTTSAGQAGAATGGVMATPDGAVHGLNQLDDWRDAFNFKGSPTPWIMLTAIGVLVFAQLSIKARAGAFGKQASVGAALG